LGRTQRESGPSLQPRGEAFEKRKSKPAEGYWLSMMVDCVRREQHDEGKRKWEERFEKKDSTNELIRLPQVLVSSTGHGGVGLREKEAKKEGMAALPYLSQVLWER